MTRFIHDQFAKQYLQEILSTRGQVETSRDMAGEMRQVDVFFVPFSQPPENLTPLGFLEQIITTSCIFEPFRNPITDSEIRGCVGKICDLCAEFERQAAKESRRIAETELPVLWILTPTFSQTMISQTAAISQAANWSAGIYSMAAVLHTKIIAIHQLPRIPETIWLRMLGKGRVQQQAISEFRQLSLDDEIQGNVLELVYNMLVMLENSQGLGQEDRELIMELSPLYQQRLNDATQQGVKQGIKQGIRQGIKQGQRLYAENLLRLRFGELDEELSAIIEALLEVPPEEVLPLLLQLSREELIHRFRN